MFNKFLKKVFSLLVLLKHGKIHHSIRYFYRDTYYCKFKQLRYFFKDYFIKKSYKEISFQGEFGAELLFVLPFAYWHFKNGTLKSTESANFTNELYFFSPNHKESFTTRTNAGNYNYEIPRVLYSQDYEIEKWEKVPFKAHFKNNIYVFDKPILIIANRYNMEWDGPPVSYYDKEILSFIIEKLEKKYTIIYNRPGAQQITMDNSEIYDLEEFNWLKLNYPQVILMEQLFAENKANASSFNHLQMLVYANANHFISVHGGTATLASYFEGINLILSSTGPEHHFGCFQRLFPKLSGATIFHAKNNDEVKDFIASKF